jgi:hypothetical protein
MSKIIAVALVSFLPVVFAMTDNAVAACPNMGYCPAGTCAKDGGKNACNVKGCSKKNCHK